MSGEILPPRESITTDDGNITQPWYRYLVSRKRITDGVSAASVVTFGDASTVFPSARSLAVASGELTETDGGEGHDLTIGLADSGVTADTYGEPTKLVVLAIDAKGRVTSASEVVLESGNVTETTNLFFTNARARSAISGGSGINYNSGTGAIATTGFSGGPALYTSLTFVDGICTAAS